MPGATVAGAGNCFKVPWYVSRYQVLPNIDYRVSNQSEQGGSSDVLRTSCFFFPTFVTVGLLVEGGPIDDFPRDVRA